MSLDSDLLARLREHLAETTVSAPAPIPTPAPPRTDPRTAQLCSQVARSLELSLSSAGDPCLNDLVVCDVRPAPDQRRLLVILTVDPDGELAPEAARSALARADGWLRGRVAMDIHRKRVPSLRFEVFGEDTP